MTTFKIHPLDRFVNPGAAIKRPTEIACFSYDEEHNFHLDDSSIKYYYTPPLGASLSEGFEKFKQLNDTADEHLDGLLRAVEDLERRRGEKVEADLITWRGMMTKIMSTPYENFNGFANRFY